MDLFTVDMYEMTGDAAGRGAMRKEDQENLKNIWRRET